LAPRRPTRALVQAPAKLASAAAEAQTRPGASPALQPVGAPAAEPKPVLYGLKRKAPAWQRKSAFFSVLFSLSQKVPKSSRLGSSRPTKALARAPAKLASAAAEAQTRPGASPALQPVGAPAAEPKPVLYGLKRKAPAWQRKSAFFSVLFSLSQKVPKSSRLGSSQTHRGFAPGAGQTRLRGRGGSNKAWRFSGPAAGGCPRCGAEAGSLRFEKEGARLAAKVSFLFCTF